MRTLPPAIALAALLLAAAPAVAASPFFPAGGVDPRSLGRGGTVIAVPGTGETVFGNPACLFPAAGFAIGANHVQIEGEGEGFWALEAADGRSGIRAAFLYLTEGAFAGFSDRVWGVALGQTVGSGITIGQSFHSGPWHAPGGEKTLSAADFGVTINPVGSVLVGYVARNVYRNDKTALARRDGYGVRIALPWTLVLAAELEESPETGQGVGRDLRVGVEASPWKELVVRGGLQRPQSSAGEEPTRYTLGVTYRDQNGTLDAGAAWDPDAKRMERVILGLTMKM
jgi:hypothetical protein